MTRDDLREALKSGQMQGFLRVIRAGESNQNDDAYTLINGGGHFSGFDAHPYGDLPTTRGGKAAGAYQFLPTTWTALVRSYGFPDFSPASQDQGAAALMLEAGAWPPILQGDIATAIDRLGKIWVSLPGIGVAKAERIFVKWGGVLPITVAGDAPQAPPQPPPVPVAPPETAPTPQIPPPSQGAPMPFLALLPLIAQFVPQIMTLLKPGSQSTAKDAAVAGTILNTVVQAAGIVADGGGPAPVNAATVGQAAEKMAADPALAKKVQEAVVTHPDVMQLLQVGEIGAGGIAAARTANVVAPEAKWWFAFFNPVVWMSLLLFGLIYIAVLNMIGLFPFQAWTENTRSNVIFLVIGNAVGGILGYWFGTTLQSGKKDAVIAQQAVGTDATG